MDTILSIKNLTKDYGPVKAVDNLTFEIKKGQIFGILGPNGSGKTTTLGTVLGVLRPTSGSFQWFEQGKSAQLRKRIGAILEGPNFYPGFSAKKNLDIIATIREIKSAPQKIDEALETVGLTKAGNLLFSEFSLGMKARLAMASVLLGSPEVLVLDEPTNGVDATGIREIRELILSLAEHGKTIILASHILDEVEKVCSHIAVLKSGKLLDLGAIDEVLASHDYIEVASPKSEELANILGHFPGCKDLKKKGELFRIFIDPKTSVLDLSQFLLNKNIPVTHLVQKKRSLESHFFELLEKS